MVQSVPTRIPWFRGGGFGDAGSVCGGPIEQEKKDGGGGGRRQEEVNYLVTQDGGKINPVR